MKNIEFEIKGDILTITVDLAKSFGRSASGKSIVIATTEGNQALPDRPEIKAGINIYTKAD